MSVGDYMKMWGGQATSDGGISRHALNLRIAQLGELARSGALSQAVSSAADKAKAPGARPVVAQELEMLKDLEAIIQKHKFFFNH